MDKPWRHYVKWNKSDKIKTNAVYSPLYGILKSCTQRTWVELKEPYMGLRSWGKGILMLIRWFRFSVITWVVSGDLRPNVMTIFDNTVLYAWNFLRKYILNFSNTIEKWKLCEVCWWCLVPKLCPTLLWPCGL